MADEIDEGIVNALRENEDQLKEIAELASGQFPPGRERDMSLLSSGFALGWTTLQSNPPATSIGMTPDFKLLVDTVTRMDQIVEGNEAPPEVMARLRNPLAEFIQGQIKSKKAQAIKVLSLMFGPAAGELIAQDRDYTDEEAVEIGFAVSVVHRGHFMGFISLLGDKRIKCQCGGHLEQGLSDFSITAEMADARMRAKYGTLTRALAAFGRWYPKTVRTALGMSPTGALDVPGILQPEEAQSVAHGMFSRLMGGTPNIP